MLIVEPDCQCWAKAVHRVSWGAAILRRAIVSVNIGRYPERPGLVIEDFACILYEEKHCKHRNVVKQACSFLEMQHVVNDWCHERDAQKRGVYTPYSYHPVWSACLMILNVGDWLFKELRVIAGLDKKYKHKPHYREEIVARRHLVMIVLYL